MTELTIFAAGFLIFMVMAAGLAFTMVEMHQMYQKSGQTIMNQKTRAVVVDRDEKLVVRAQGGDNGAFEELMRRTAPASLRQATAILRNHQLAEDEVQNAYLAAWRHLNQFQGNAKFTTWINRIVTNQCLMRLRSLRKSQLVSLDATIPIDGTRRLIGTLNGSTTPESLLGCKEEASVMSREIGKLPSGMRSVLLLRDLDEMTTFETASRLGITPAAVKSRLLRARLELKRRLERVRRCAVGASYLAT